MRIKTLLVTLELAESHSSDKEVLQFGVSNTVGEWAKQAQTYFSKSLFSEAGFCFRKAEMTWWADVALAYGQRQAALRLPEKDSERTNAFSKVAIEFDRLAQQAQKTEYPENLRLMFLNAAESYVVISDHVRAAKSFLKAQKPTEAAYYFRLAGLFDQAVKVVRHFPVDPVVAESIKYAAMVVYTRKRDLPSLQKARKLCETQDQFFEFLRDHGFEDQRITFLDSISDHEEVAQALWENGDHVAAVHRFRKSSTSSSRRKASRCLSEAIAANVFFAESYGNPSSLASQLFDLAKDTLLSSKDRTEITLFRAVATLNSADLKLHSQRCLDTQDTRGAFLALDAWTQSGALSALEKADDQDAAEILLLCHKFSMAVKTVIRAHFDDSEFQRMFGIASAKGADSSQPHEIVVQRVVLPHSFIYATALHSAGRSSETASAGGDPVTLPRQTVDDMLRHALLERLNSLLDTVDLLARKSRSFDLCIRFLTTGRCGTDTELCWREHLQKDQLNVAKFNARFRLHLLTIALLDQFTAIHGLYDEEKSRATKQRIWIERLFQVCYPLTNKCGNLSDITPALIPEFSIAIPVVKSWLQEIFRGLRPGKQTILFLKTLLITSLLATAFDYTEAVSYLWRGRWSEYPFIAARESLIHPSDNRPIAGSALAWFARKYEPRINFAVYFIEHVLTNPVWLDVDVVMSYIEEVCGQLIVTYYAHRRDAYDGLTLPRSWIVRAFVRAPSLRVVGNLPSQLVTALAKFLDILLLRPNSGTRTRLTVSGKEVERAPIAVRSHAIGQLCRCLALIGWNIPLEHNKLRKRVLGIFKAMVINPPPWSDFYGYATAQNWDDVVNWLKASGPSPSLDELITVLQKEGPPSTITGSRTVFCPDEKKLLQRLQLTPHPPAITLHADATQRGSTQSSVAEVRPGGKDIHVSGEGLESLGYVKEEWKGASVIQAFYRRRRRRAGGPLALAPVFEDLANRIIKASEPNPPERYILLCLRGPLPHVLAYLQTMKDVTQDADKALITEMSSSDHEAIDELYMKRKEVQDVRATLSELLEELHPASDFYFQRTSKAPVSLITIVEKVKSIPILLTNIRKFCNCSENDDYDLGVEPLLSPISIRLLASYNFLVPSSLNMEEALAAFSIRGRIDSKLALDVALTNLSTALQQADTEIPTLLHALVRHTNGLLEAVMTSRNEGAFIFRSRILRMLEKSSHHPHPIFLTCAERFGAFLISLPPWITLDAGVLQGYNALSISLTSDNPEAGDFIRKKEVSPVRKSTPKIQRAPKTKKKKRFVPLSLSAQDPPREEPKEDPDNLPESPETQKHPLSPNDIKRRPSTSESLSKQLIACLGAYFTACTDDAIEEFALDELLKTLAPTSEPLFLPQPTLEPGTVKNHSPTSDPPNTEAVAAVSSKPSFRLLLAPKQVAIFLSDSISLHSGEWHVVVSQKGIRQFQQYSSDDRAMLNRVKTTICELSEGTFAPSNYLEIVSQKYGIPIYAANLTGGRRLVYQIDFGAPMDSRREAQFIRIFGVYPNSTINTEFWKAVSTQLAYKGPIYIQSCIDRAEARKLAKGARSVAPSLLPPLDVSKSYKTENRVKISELHLHELHRLLSSEKYIPVKPSFFDAIHKFGDSNFMFAVSSAEDRIIKYPSSCLIMGRSGTGKTTCMIFRMIKLNLASDTFGRKLRQVFVTHSRTLARRVRLYCAELMQTETHQPEGSARKSTAGPLLLDMDESAEEDGVLPSKFSQLQDSHFPLCLNFDQLCGLLEADFNLEFNPSPSPTRQALRAKSKKGASRDTLISFEYFDSQIWAHFDQRLKKGLHPALVYSEFMGIIKGSESTLGKPRRCLSREDYEGQTNRSLSGESTERTRIYTLFEAYQKLRPPFSYDTADRVQTLVDVLRENGVPGSPIDFLYVDEGQDNLIIDAALLRSLCSNPYGLFFAGDTAQTISVGSAFRFSELKAFLYRLERDDVEVKSGAREAVDPHFFQLSTNYRSHGGIVQAAAFIVHLLTTYFPHSIDPLAPEVPHVDPLFFSSRRNQSEFLRLISGSQSGEVELGAHQVIIVRDEAASARLRNLIDQAAIVLTIYESKGMEFDDVVLYDFFDDSLATKTDWRAMLLAHQQSRTFDGRRHTILQSELKALYVGLTRAKQRVWIWDQSEKARIAETLLVGLKLAESYEFSQEVPLLGVSASPEEWDRQAQQYFSKSLFAEAAFCFRKAGMTWWADVARAYGERQAASKLSKNHPESSNVLARVANSFANLARQAIETEYPENIRLLFLNSAEAYAMIPDHAVAAELFLKALKYTESAYHYRMAGLFDEAIEVVKRYTVDPSVAERIIYAAKIVLAKRGDMVSLHKAWHLCEDKVQFLEFLQDNGFAERRVPFLENTSSSRHRAAQCLREGIAEHVFFATNYGEQSDQLSQLFNLSEATWLSADAKAEVEMFQAVTTLKTSELQLHGERCLANGDVRGAMLALDAWITSGGLSGLAQADDQNAAELLLLCRRFAKTVKTTAQTPGLIDSPPMQKIFGITSPSSNYMSSSSGVIVQRMVLPQSFIYSAAQNSTRRVGGPTTKAANPVVLSKNSINSILRNALLEKLNRVLSEVDLLARKSRAFGLCTRFLTLGRCTNGAELCWRDHVHWSTFTVMKFNSKFRLHTLLIALLDEFVATDQRQKEQTHVIRQK
ncbi:hypothetical protein FS837_002667 [Tulasnella sp. UAMH 9824]|nr:hypothetical protein FS837_002667 [Tulasnella sp. UAMH 9824]